jgi:hypothetical protein
VPSESVTAMISALLGCHSRSSKSVSVLLTCLLLVCSSFSAAASKPKNSREPVDVATHSVDPSFEPCGVHSMSSTAESRGTVCTCVLKDRQSPTWLSACTVRLPEVRRRPTTLFLPIDTISECQCVSEVYLQVALLALSDEESMFQRHSNSDAKSRTPLH